MALAAHWITLDLLIFLFKLRLDTDNRAMSARSIQNGKKEENSTQKTHYTRNSRPIWSGCRISARAIFSCIPPPRMLLTLPSLLRLLAILRTVMHIRCRQHLIFSVIWFILLVVPLDSNRFFEKEKYILTSAIHIYVATVTGSPGELWVIKRRKLRDHERRSISTDCDVMNF